MRHYIIHYASKRGGIAYDVQSGRDVFDAVRSYMEFRPLGAIVAVRRLTNDHAKWPVYL